jgi:hypothetical protein
VAETASGGVPAGSGALGAAWLGGRHGDGGVRTGRRGRAAVGPLPHWQDMCDDGRGRDPVRGDPRPPTDRPSPQWWHDLVPKASLLWGPRRRRGRPAEVSPRIRTGHPEGGLVRSPLARGRSGGRWGRRRARVLGLGAEGAPGRSSAWVSRDAVREPDGAAGPGRSPPTGRGGPSAFGAGWTARKAIDNSHILSEN